MDEGGRGGEKGPGSGSGSRVGEKDPGMSCMLVPMDPPTHARARARAHTHAHSHNVLYAGAYRPQYPTPTHTHAHAHAREHAHARTHAHNIMSAGAYGPPPHNTHTTSTPPLPHHPRTMSCMLVSTSCISSSLTHSGLSPSTAQCRAVYLFCAGESSGSSHQ